MAGNLSDRIGATAPGGRWPGILRLGPAPGRPGNDPAILMNFRKPCNIIGYRAEPTGEIGRVGRTSHSRLPSPGTRATGRVDTGTRSIARAPTDPFLRVA